MRVSKKEKKKRRKLEMQRSPWGSGAFSAGGARCDASAANTCPVEGSRMTTAVLKASISRERQETRNGNPAL